MRTFDRLDVLKLAAAADVDPRSARKALKALTAGQEVGSVVRGRAGERIARALPDLGITATETLSAA